MPQSAEEITELLDLESIDVNLFRGTQPETRLQRVFGGQVAAQAMVAGARTVDPDLSIHSLHSYFLRPGDPTVPIVYDVEVLRDGRSFSTRRVEARQHGHAIYYQTANFQRFEEGLDHQQSMPSTPGPEEGIPLAQLAGREREARERWDREWAGIDVRHIGVTGMGLPEDADGPPRARLWVRVAGDLPEDPVIQQAAFVYASDLTLLGASLVPHGVHLGSPRLVAASLDHTVWFHRPFRADEWWLYDQFSPSAQGGRGLALAEVYAQDGRLVATLAQEGVIRIRRETVS